MKIHSIMVMKEDLFILKEEDSIGFAIEKMKELKRLSLPVSDEEDEITHIISIADINEKYFSLCEVENMKKEDFLNEAVLSVSKRLSSFVSVATYVEDAANLFLKNDLNFIPVIGLDGKTKGIVTQKSLFSVITKILGTKDPKIVIYSSDFPGTLGKICNIIAKEGGNITSVSKYNTDVLGVQEISIRVKGDVLKIAERLKKEKIQVREILG